MLIHPWDAGTSTEQWVEFVRRQGFGHLVAAGRVRDVPVVVPTQYSLVSPSEVALHLARPNPIWTALDENPNVLLSVAGEWAYIPAAWKAIGDEDPAFGVPTTYYAAVQLIGTATVLDGFEDKVAILRRQLGDTEPGSGAVDPAQHGRGLNPIRGLRIDVREVRSKFKYGGNVDAEHRAAVAAGLETRQGPGDNAARARMSL